MKSCVQCEKEIKIYASFGGATLVDNEGKVKGIETRDAYYCNHFDCPNYGLLAVPQEDMPGEYCACGGDLVPNRDTCEDCL